MTNGELNVFAAEVNKRLAALEEAAGLTYEAPARLTQVPGGNSTLLPAKTPAAPEPLAPTPGVMQAALDRLNAFLSANEKE